METPVDLTLRVEHNPRMSVRGVIKNGRVELPPGTELPEGAAVTLTLDAEQAQKPEWVQQMAALAKPRAWPPDYVRNLDAHLAVEAKGR